MMASRSIQRRSKRQRRRAAGKALAAPALGLFFTVGSLILTGCSNTSDWSFGNRSKVQSQNDLGLPNYEDVTAPTRSYVHQEAQHHQVPDYFVAEARIGLAAIEKELADARAMDVEQSARFNEGLARVNAGRQHAESRERQAMADAEKIQKQYTARQNELWAIIASRQRTLDSEVEENAALIEALRNEREMVYSELTSRANQDYSRAQAQIDKLRTIRETTSTEGQAALTELRQQVKATESRAEATTAKLRSEATSTRDQAVAVAEELRARISSVREQSQAEATRLAQDAESIEKAAIARYNEMLARAEAMTAQTSKEQYELEISTAETELRKARAEHGRLLNEAKTTLERAEAEVARLRSEADQIEQVGMTRYTFGLDELESWHKSELAELSKIRHRADRVEKDARAAFVQAEAEARANAKRETAEHQGRLAEAQMKAIIADAEAEALRVRTEIVNEIAQRQKEGSVEMSGKTDPAPELPKDLHDVPPTPQVDPVTPRVEPERIAAFRSSLAEVMNLRAQADAKELALNATYQESIDRLNVLQMHFHALSTEKQAVADAMEVQANAQFSDLTTQANAMLSLAESDHSRAMKMAEAYRKEMLAKAADLRGEATSIRETAIAHAELLRNEASVVRKNGQSEIRALEAALDATQRRGEADYRRLLVEADAVEQSHKALAMQIQAQIAAAERMLTAELAKQDRAIESGIVIAEANFNEALVNADVFARRSEVELERMAAQNAHQQALASAEIEHLRNLTFSTVLKADAEVGRLVASARSERQKAEAFADAVDASLHAQSDIARAEIMARSRTAEAHESSVRAHFDARLAQVQSDRVRNMVNQYRDDFYQRSNLEMSLAEVEAIRAQMNERFAALKVEQENLQRTASRNWDARLATMQRRPATPMPSPKFDLPEEIEQMQITNVPISHD